MSKIFQHKIFSNYLPSTVYQGAYKFYNKEQLFSHVLQFNIFHHKLKFSFNFTIIIYPFPQWHLRSPISPLPSEGIQYATKSLLIYYFSNFSYHMSKIFQHKIFSNYLYHLQFIKVHINWVSFIIKNNYFRMLCSLIHPITNWNLVSILPLLHIPSPSGTLGVRYLPVSTAIRRYPVCSKTTTHLWPGSIELGQHTTSSVRTVFNS